MSNGKRSRLLTLEDIFHPERKEAFAGPAARVRTWVSTHHYLEHENDERSAWNRVDARDGRSEPLYDLDLMRVVFESLDDVPAADAARMCRPSNHCLNADQSAALIQHNSKLFYYRLGSNRVTLLDGNIDREVRACLSPNDRMASYIKNGNLHIADLESGRTRQLTTRGGGEILSGRLDWVYQEELYGRGQFVGHWWSPDATQLAFLELDTSEVQSHWTADHVRGPDPSRTPYPRAGETNPRVRLGVVGVREGELTWIDTSRYASVDHLIVRVAWASPMPSIVYQVQDREQRWLDLASSNPETGQSVTFFRETTEAWVRVLDNPRWLKDGSFLWLSERTGRKHIYHYGPDHQLVGPITSGDWDVCAVYGVDTANHWVYFSATENSPIAPHTYRIRLDGSGLERLTHREGTHSSSFSPDFRYFIDTWSNASAPPEVCLHQVGDEDRVADPNALDRSPISSLDTFEWGRTDFLEVPARDGFKLPGMMIKPSDFNPNRKYPVLCHLYGGPMTPRVQNAWGGAIHAWHHLLAQRGSVVWISDNRSSSGRGAVRSWPIYRRFGQVELSDLEDGITWLKSQRYIDPDRFGVWGWSFGGYLALYAMTHTTLFRMGIAGAPVTDWRLYDSIYTERYMGLPSTNPDGYQSSSVLEAADQLHGKLLILHGTMDDNVHVDHSMRLVYRLQKAGKDFETMFYPRSGHKIEDPEQLYHMQGLMTDFVIENL